MTGVCPSLIKIGSKTAEKNSAQTNRQTNKQTDRQTDTTKIMVTWPWIKISQCSSTLQLANERWQASTVMWTPMWLSALDYYFHYHSCYQHVHYLHTKWLHNLLCFPVKFIFVKLPTSKSNFITSWPKGNSISWHLWSMGICNCTHSAANTNVNSAITSQD